MKLIVMKMKKKLKIIDTAAKNLVRINNKIKNSGGKPAKSLCVICGLTNAAYRREDSVYVVPITSLKD